MFSVGSKPVSVRVNVCILMHANVCLSDVCAQVYTRLQSCHACVFYKQPSHSIPRTRSHVLRYLPVLASTRYRKVQPGPYPELSIAVSSDGTFFGVTNENQVMLVTHAAE